MSSRLSKYSVTFAMFLVLVVPMLVLAYYVNNPASGILPSYANSPKDLTIRIINIVLGFAGLLAVLFIIVGGFQYIFSGANEEWAENGKKTLRNAIIGLVVIILSYVIVNVISQALSQ